MSAKRFDPVGRNFADVDRFKSPHLRGNRESGDPMCTGRDEVHGPHSIAQVNLEPVCRKVTKTYTESIVNGHALVQSAQ